MHWPRSASWITGHSKQIRQKHLRDSKQTFQGDNVTYLSIVTGLSTASLQASWASASLASNLMVSWGRLFTCDSDMWNSNLFKFSALHISFVSSKQTISYCQPLKQYTGAIIIIQIWYILMHRILFGDVLKFYKFLFCLVYYDAYFGTNG